MDTTSGTPVQDICRICRETKNLRSVVPSAEMINVLDSLFSIQIESPENGGPPQRMCGMCYDNLQHIVRLPQFTSIEQEGPQYALGQPQVVGQPIDIEEALAANIAAAFEDQSGSSSEAESDDGAIELLMDSVENAVASDDVIIIALADSSTGSDTAETQF